MSCNHPIGDIVTLCASCMIDKNREAVKDAIVRAAAQAENERPIKLAIYTTDDGRITEVVERDEDGDPVDRAVEAGAVIAHVEKLVVQLTASQAENERLEDQIDSLALAIGVLETRDDEVCDIGARALEEALSIKDTFAELQRNLASAQAENERLTDECHTERSDHC